MRRWFKICALFLSVSDLLVANEIFTERCKVLFGGLGKKVHSAQVLQLDSIYSGKFGGRHAVVVSSAFNDDTDRVLLALRIVRFKNSIGLVGAGDRSAPLIARQDTMRMFEMTKEEFSKFQKSSQVRGEVKLRFDVTSVPRSRPYSDIYNSPKGSILRIGDQQYAVIDVQNEKVKVEVYGRGPDEYQERKRIFHLLPLLNGMQNQGIILPVQKLYLNRNGSLFFNSKQIPNNDVEKVGTGINIKFEGSISDGQAFYAPALVDQIEPNPRLSPDLEFTFMISNFRRSDPESQVVSENSP